MVNYMTYDTNSADPTNSLAKWARLPINRCNLPAEILGSLGFQQQPEALVLDGVHMIHDKLFEMLALLQDPFERAQQFDDYLRVHLRLNHPEELGAGPTNSRARLKADYLSLLRGWSFNSDSREGAVLKGWVESRFGLLARFHNGSLADYQSPTFREYLKARSDGLYNTSALETQLDLLYSFCQDELIRRETPSHLCLYRGVNRLEDFDVLDRPTKKSAVLILNNLNSFSASVERASEFGDTILKVRVPKQKILCFADLLPTKIKGEDEYLVIGGAYRVDVL